MIRKKSSKLRRFLSILAAGLAFAGVTTDLHGQTTYFWDADITQPGEGVVAPTDGGGVWNLTNVNWVLVTGMSEVQGNYGAGNGRPTIFGANGVAGVIDVTATTIAPGSLTFEQTSSGRYIFTGSNIAVSGGITVNNSNGVQFGNGGTTGSFTAATGVSLAGTQSGIFFNRSDDVTVAALISGGGNKGLTQLGSGTLTLTANNTYSGPTNVNAGTLSIGNGGASGSIASGTVNVASGATLVFNRSNDVSFAGNIVGAGNLRKEAANVLTLSGTNTYSGTTTINGGTLTLGSANALGSGNLSINNGSTLNLGSFSDSVGAVTMASGSITGSGTLTASSFTVQSGTISANLSSTGAFTKAGTGTVVLSGATNSFGSITVNSGTLETSNNVTSASTGIGTGSTLTGTGTVTGNINIAAGGILSPGTSPGTLNITGDLDLNGTYNWEFNNTTADLVNVTGNLDLSGSTLNIIELASAAIGNIYTLFGYTGALTGTFNGLADDSTFTVGGNIWEINYNNGSPGLNGGNLGSTFVTLTLTAVPEPSSLALVTLVGVGLTLRRSRRK